MNLFNPLHQREAKLKYLDGHIEMVQSGDYVVCALTGKQIPLESLHYWNVDLQEAYCDAEAATKRWQALQSIDDN